MQATKRSFEILEDAPPQKEKWRVTQEAFDQFLACLELDREQAGLEYEKIRTKLVSFFECRDCRFAEDYADETINRVVRKIGEGESIREPRTYVYGVARMIILEIAKEQHKQRAAYDELPHSNPFAEDLEPSDIKIEYLKRCLEALPQESRALITQYYEGERRSKIDNRKKLSEQMSIPLNALRIRAHRLREKLVTCIDKCMQQAK
jgi:DNA-directed RNA polymerase specialized sigma24 family protein